MIVGRRAYIIASLTRFHCKPQHLTMYGNAVLLEVEVFTAQQANL
jgi:hypothetical protein